MPQSSLEYAIGSISVLSTHLLTQPQLRRIVEAPTTKEALSVLLETGYAEGVSEAIVQEGEIDKIIREQMQLSRKKIMGLTPDEDLTGLFLLDVDTHNIKTLLKARLLGTDGSEFLRDGGVFSLELLKDAIATKYYDDLPEIYAVTMNKIETELVRGIDPLRFSAQIDGAMFKEVAKVLQEKNEHGFIKDYFSLWADFLNAESLLRARLMKWDVDKLRFVLVEAGDMDFKTFTENMETPPEQLVQKLNVGKNGTHIAQAINEYMQTKDMTIINKHMHTALLDILREKKWDYESMGPVIGYLVARQTEAIALRAIFGAKQGGFEVELPELFS